MLARSIDSIEAKSNHILTDSEKELCDIEKGDLIADSPDLLNVHNKNGDEYLEAGDTVKHYSTPAEEDADEYLLLDLPNFLMGVANHVAVQVGENLWMRVSDFNKFEIYCEHKGTMSEGVLHVHAVEDISLRSCCDLRDCFIDNSGMCKTVKFEITNLDFVMGRAAIIDCHFSTLIKENLDLNLFLQQRLNGISLFPEEKDIHMLQAGCEEAIDKLIAAMIKKGLDIHDILKKAKPEIHEHLFVEAGCCDVCVAGRSVKSEPLTRLKTYEEELDALYPAIGSVQEQRVTLLSEQAKFASAHILWRARTDLASLLECAIKKVHLEKEGLMDFCSRHNFVGTRLVQPPGLSQGAAQGGTRS